MKVFLSYKFGIDEFEAQARLVRRIIKACGHRVIDGRDVNKSNSLNDQIKKLIDSCDCFVSIQNIDHITNYLRDEYTYAASKEKIMLSIVSDGIVPNGLQDNIPFVSFIREINVQTLSECIETFMNWRASEIFGSKINQKDLGDNENEIIRQLASLKLFDARRQKKDFKYHVTIENSDDVRAYPAQFKISFSSKIPSGPLVIEAHRAENRFHDKYIKLNKNPASVYRYLIKFPDTEKFKNDDFSVLKFQINDSILSAPNITHQDDKIIYEYEIPQSVIVGEEADFIISIKTVLPAKQNEFTMIFGYPVNGIDTSFQLPKGLCSNIDVVDTLTSMRSTIKDKISLDKAIVGATVAKAGWIIPESAITYVWSF
jgi:hypothetical protein